MKNLLEYSKRIKGDRIIWTVLIFLSLFSVLVVYSSTGALAFRKLHGNTSYFFLRQILFTVLGFGFMLSMIKFIPVSLYNKYANLAFIGAIMFVLLGILVGRDDGGSGRTISLMGFSFQPAELAKIALVVWVARILSKCNDDQEKLNKAFFKIMAGVSILCLLIVMVNFSSAFLLFVTASLMMWFGKVKFKYLISIYLFGVMLLIMIFVMKPYLSQVYEHSRLGTVHNRIDRFIHGDEAREEGLTQDDFAKIAINRGGLFGVGVGKSDISNRMSAAYNDFIFAIIVEEYGLIGALGIILLYLILLRRSRIIVKNCRKSFPAFLATGIITLIMLQAMVNMGVSAGAIPVTGQPLPWISWGGTSQLFTAIAFGFLLSVSADNHNTENQESLENDTLEEDEMEEELMLVKSEK